MGNAPPCAFFPRSRRGCCSDSPAKPDIPRLRFAPVSVYQDENAGSRGRVFHSRASRAAAGLNLPVYGKRMGRARPFKTLRRRFSQPGFSAPWKIGRFVCFSHSLRPGVVLGGLSSLQSHSRGLAVLTFSCLR